LPVILGHFIPPGAPHGAFEKPGAIPLPMAHCAIYAQNQAQHNKFVRCNEKMQQFLLRKIYALQQKAVKGAIFTTALVLKVYTYKQSGLAFALMIFDACRSDNS
jgi:hypothetical protein